MIEYFYDLSTLVALTTLAAAYANRLFALKGQPAQILAWAMGFLVTAVGKLFALGFVALLSWQEAGLVAIGVALASNGVFDVEMVKRLLVFLKARVK